MFLFCSNLAAIRTAGKTFRLDRAAAGALACIFAMGAAIPPGLAMPLNPASIHGFWRPPDGGRIEIETCGEHLCGYVRDDGDGPPEVHPGHLLLRELRYQGALTWTEGTIHNPRDDRTYGAKLRLMSRNKLKLTGCAWIFCGSQTWTRIE